MFWLFYIFVCKKLFSDATFRITLENSIIRTHLILSRNLRKNIKVFYLYSFFVVVVGKLAYRKKI
jgi:hypothetical protein